MPRATNEPSLKEAMRLTRAKSNRLSWALNAYGHFLAAAVYKDTSPEAREVSMLPDEQVPAHVARLIQDRADPTVAKTMTGWLVKQYAQRALRLEDLGTAYETLDMFHRYAQRLPKGEQDLGQYPNLAAVWDAVIGFANAEEPHISGKGQKALDRDKAYAESRILRQDDDGFTVAVPLTEFAAKWWGRGTRWCTAAEKENQFWHYHQHAPLIVMVIPELKEKGKFQIWVKEHEFQFMNAGDEPVSEALVAGYWPRFKPIISFALRQNGLVLNHVPLTVRTEGLCRIAVAQAGEVLYQVPWSLRTEELCRIAVAQNGWALQHVSLARRTEEMCRIAVAQNGWALDLVPEDLRTEEMCRIAVAQNGWALQHVPLARRTEEMCRIAMSQDGWALEHVPEDLRTEENCRIAVANFRRALEHVPLDLCTDDMCRIAVAQDGRALEYVPQTLRTDEMCRIAVAQNGWALECVPQVLCTDEMYRLAMAQDGRTLQYVPKALRTEDLCEVAMAQDSRALEHVPLDLRTDDMCRIAVAQDGRALEYVPEDLRTEELCRIAVVQNGRALEHVPENLRDRISALIPLPIPAWDVSLLDELATFLISQISPAPLGIRYA
jgi:hypothetical protein